MKKVILILALIAGACGIGAALLLKFSAPDTEPEPKPEEKKEEPKLATDVNSPQ